MQQVLSELVKYLQQVPDKEIEFTGLKKNDLTECSEILRQAFACEKAIERKSLLNFGREAVAVNQGKDGFYTKIYNEIMLVQAQQEKVFKEEKGQFNINGSLGESLGHWATQQKGKNSEICRNLKKELKLDEQVYF